MDLDSLLAAIAAHLASELGEGGIADELAAVLRDDVLSWRAPEIRPEQVDTIVAFTFGNRMLATGNRLAGPVNEALADIAVRLHEVRGAAIYAQWEVAEAVGRRVPQDKLTPIFPRRDERAEPVYLNTADVVSTVVGRVNDARALGRVGVVAFSDHLFRCVTTAQRLGLDAGAPTGYVMPRDYDPQSGQPWCRSRLAYLMHDIMIRVTERRSLLMEQSRRAE